jgi:tripartite-type tricarboxylate transporter receptor subunit TctC
MSLRRRRFLQVATSATALLAMPRICIAQSYPTRSITLVVPFPPGGSTDVAGRILADRMAAVLGQPVIIENVGGAGGSIGVGRVARAVPDGYVIEASGTRMLPASSTIPITICRRHLRQSD